MAFKLNNTTKLATAYTNKGVNFNTKNDDSLALCSYQKALSLFQKMDKKENAAGLFHDMGLIYQKSDYYKALDYYKMSLNVFMQLHDNEKTAKVLRSMGIVYNFLSDYPKALKYQQNALNIYELSGNKAGMAGVFANIGLVYLHSRTSQRLWNTIKRH